jgi:EmrB/QacA subfamily drug resistance transporter
VEDLDDCQRWTLRVVCISTGLLLLAVAAPNVALRAISADLGASFTDLQWVLSGYALALAVFQLTAGSLADLFGRRRLFLIGLGVFAAASLLSALAPSPAALVVARVIQGVGAAIVFPSSLALLAQEFEGQQRRRAIGLWGAVIGLAFAAGPLLGGVLVDTLGWRWVFAVNVVLGVPMIVLAARHVRESRDPDPSPIDWPGVTTLCLALFLLVFAVLRGNALGWTSAAVLGLLAGGAAMLVAFVAAERAREHPMIDLALFRNRTFTGASLVVAGLAGLTFGTFVYVSLFLLNVQERSAVEAGLVLAPLAVVSFVVSALAGRLSGSVPLAPALACGLVLAGVGMLLLSTVEVGSSWLALLPGLMVIGAGVGLTNPLATFAHLGVLPPAHGGVASALNNTARQVGLAVGIAGLGALLQASVRSDVEDAAAAAGDARATVLDRVADGDVAAALQAAPPEARADIAGAYARAFTDALSEQLVLGGLVVLAVAAAAALLIRQSDLWTPPAAVAGAPAGAPEPAGVAHRPEP